MSVRSVITALGGTTKVAEDLGVEASCVSNWLARGRIPPGRWLTLSEIAEGRGVADVTFEALARLHRTAEPAGASS